MVKEFFYGNIIVKVIVVVEFLLGVFILDVEGNVSCIFVYDLFRGLNIEVEEVFVILKFGQLVFEYYLNIKYYECCYEGKDKIEFQFEVKNFNIVIVVVVNVIIDILVLFVDIEVQSFLVMLCSSILVFNMIGN